MGTPETRIVQKEVLELVKPLICSPEGGSNKIDDPFCSSDPKTWPSVGDGKQTRISYPEDPNSPSIPGTQYFCADYLQWYKKQFELPNYISTSDQQLRLQVFLNDIRDLAVFCKQIKKGDAGAASQPASQPVQNTDNKGKPWWKSVWTWIFGGGGVGGGFVLWRLIKWLGKQAGEGGKATKELGKGLDELGTGLDEASSGISKLRTSVHRFFAAISNLKRSWFTKPSKVVSPEREVVRAQLAGAEKLFKKQHHVVELYIAQMAIDQWNNKSNPEKRLYIDEEGGVIPGKLPKKYIKDFIETQIKEDQMEALEAAAGLWVIRLITEAPPDAEKIKKQLGAGTFKDERPEVFQYLTWRALHNWGRLSESERAKFVDMKNEPVAGELPAKFIGSLEKEITPAMARKLAAIIVQVDAAEPDLIQHRPDAIDARVQQLVELWDQLPGTVREIFGPVEGEGLPSEFIELTKRSPERMSDPVKILERVKRPWIFNPTTGKHDDVEIGYHLTTRVPPVMYLLGMENPELNYYPRLLELLAKRIVSDWHKLNPGDQARFRYEDQNTTKFPKMSDVPSTYVRHWYSSRHQDKDPKDPKGGHGSGSAGGGGAISGYTPSGETSGPAGTPQGTPINSHSMTYPDYVISGAQGIWTPVIPFAPFAPTWAVTPAPVHVP